MFVVCYQLFTVQPYLQPTALNWVLIISRSRLALTECFVLLDESRHRSGRLLIKLGREVFVRSLSKNVVRAKTFANVRFPGLLCCLELWCHK